MYKFLKFNVISAITLSTFMYAGSAFAEGCNEGSPNRISQGEAYFDLDLVANPSNKEKALLGAFVKSISGEWNGALTELECFGPANNPRPVHTDSDVQVKITEGLNNALSLNHEAYYSDEKKTSLRSIDALGENNLFSLVFFEEDTVSFSEKSRRNNGNSGNFLVEEFYKIQRSGGIVNCVFDYVYKRFFCVKLQLGSKPRVTCVSTFMSA